MLNKITKIVSQKRKGRFNVFINDKYAFPISEEVMIKYRIFKGTEIDDELKNKLLAEDNKSKLYDKAINYLSYKLRTEYEIKQFLKKSTDDEDQINSIMDKLLEQKLLGDQNYADSFVRTELRKHDKGPNDIFNKLKFNHIDEEKINLAINNNYKSDDIINNGIFQAKKAFKHYKNDGYNLRLQKVRQHLIKKGYPINDLDTIINLSNLENDVDQQQDALQMQGDKAYRRYSRLEPIKRDLKLRQFLYRKGFDLDDINVYLENKKISESEEFKDE
ncbi:RecX family transcriptional regulator [Apilactobacillus xinyiensis]|uniref:RecX family transcriptional regulator n=1 Tax=Apilactobacillus xinyiensis TaxID=2841032 RepID=UPI001C7D62E8|nr:RecX family transcriptional regulator [Apilactobacillus xinyiensis]MCL0319176.1 RecX family transcriptional regulator [Apilactobacillus xinyiensis]